MDKPMNNLAFRIMSLIFKCRDALRPREIILQETGIKKGHTVLDFGCGPGSYVVPVSRLIGEQGRVYALDIHPMAIEKIKALATTLGLSNVETIRSDFATGLPDKTIDVVLLYDIFHMLNDKKKVLSEIHRVLKDDGVLSFSDHHMKEKDILSGIQASSLFKLRQRNAKTYSFGKLSTN